LFTSHVRYDYFQLLRLMPRITLPPKARGHGAANQDDADEDDDLR
jgi:hypothetical protein